MTKIYRGMHGGQVTVEDGGKVTVLPPFDPTRVDFAWGNSSAGASHLSLALAESVLGNREEAVRFYQRLKYRTVMLWPKAGQWSISEKDILSHIEDMRQTERMSAQAKAMVTQQPAPVAYEGGTGIGGIPIKRSQQDGGPGPEVPPERRAQPAQATNIAAAVTVGIDVMDPQRPPNGHGEAIP